MSDWRSVQIHGANYAERRVVKTHMATTVPLRGKNLRRAAGQLLCNPMYRPGVHFDPHGVDDEPNCDLCLRVAKNHGLSLEKTS